MKKVILVTGIALLLAVVAISAGCVGSDPIVGTWDASLNVAGIDVASSSMTFNADGTGKTTGNLVIFSAATAFDWKKVSDGKYTLSTGGVAKEVSVTFENNGKTMIMDGAKFTKRA